MKNTGRLLDALNEILGPKNMIHSTVKEVKRFYDPKIAEHVFTLEYRVKVAPTGRPGRTRQTGSLLSAILEPGNPETNQFPGSIGSSESGNPNESGRTSLNQ